MSVDSGMPTEGSTQLEKSVPLPPALENLSKLVSERPEALATGSEDLRKAALDATKFIFDLALTTEPNATNKVNELLTSISPNHAPQTRSQTADTSRKRKRGSTPPSAAQFPLPSLQETPIAELFVDGMSDEQIWAELELRAQNVCDVLDYALDGPTQEAESGEDEDGSGDEEDEHELKKMRQALIDEGFDPDELEGMGFDEEDEDDSDEDEEDEEEEDESEEDEDGTEDAHLGEDVQGLRDPSDEEDEDEEDLEAEPSFLSGGKRTLKLKPKRGGHPVLDDGFFDLAAFNAEIEAAESKNVSRGRLSKDDDDEDEEDDAEPVDYFAPVDDTTAFDEEDLEGGGELFYRDFFEPPSRKMQVATKPPKVADKPSSSTGKVRFHEEVKVRKIKAKGKNLPVSAMFYEEEEDDGEDDVEYEDEDGVDSNEDEDEEMGEDEGPLDSDSEEAEEDGEDVSMDDEEDEQSGLATMERLKDDLFADDEENVQEGLSTYEKRMAALREEISALEEENVGKKEWTLMGEATSRSRPQNSLLEEDLEFERIIKSVPVITEEVVHSLEERIKARILDNQFDDVVRKRPVDDKPFLPSRFFELQDTKSKQSLAEIYEDEYTAAQTGGATGEDRDGKLKKEHQEIEKLWENICSKLDALCNAHFTPKAPKATITSVSNVAAATLESALPTTKATSTMLAPEEVYAPASSDMRARSELTPAEKRALRNKQKKTNKKARDAIDKSVQKFGRPKGLGDVKRQKEAALKTLVKSGKGVTVVGKKSKEVEGKRGPGKT
ncbi:U3 small nucleolar ribonucleoprotein complex, subunit Mpp10 [Cerioporus squamosus]|nr:U3 small nucleolar ribonucleoprotein complex, subunit Mpp10 [Cerioporus squamosus]